MVQLRNHHISLEQQITRFLHVIFIRQVERLLNFHGTQLFTACGAILLSIESASFLEDEDDKLLV